MAEKARANALRVKELERTKLLDRQRELKNHPMSDWAKFSNIESELKNIEADLVAEFGEVNSEDELGNEKADALYCVACNKVFKTQKAFGDHENSKKHKDHLMSLKKSVEDQDSEDEEPKSLKSDAGSSENDSNPGKAEKREAVSGSSSKKGLKMKEPRSSDGGATGSEMPDFLLNPEKNVVTVEDGTSEDELCSEDAEDLEESSLKDFSKVKGERSSEVDDLYVFPQGTKVTGQEDQEETSPEELISDQEDEATDLPARKKKKKVKTVRKVGPELSSDDDNFDLELGLSKKQRKKRRNLEELVGRKDATNELEERAPESKTNEAETRDKEETAKTSHAAEKKENKNQDSADAEHRCVTCKIEFSSRNKLFDHLWKTYHFE